MANKHNEPTVEEMVENRRLLIIRWDDHWSSGGWKDLDAHLTDANMAPYFCVSVGWEIGRNDKVVKLVQSLAEGDRCADVVTILLSDIVSEEEIVFA